MLQRQVKSMKLRVGSDPHKLVTAIQSMSDEEAAAYIERQVKNLAVREAGKIEGGRGGPVRGMHEVRSRMRAINRAAKERELKFRAMLSKYNIKVLKWGRISDDIVVAHYIEKERH